MMPCKNETKLIRLTSTISS